MSMFKSKGTETLSMYKTADGSVALCSIENSRVWLASTYTFDKTTREVRIGEYIQSREKFLNAIADDKKHPHRATVQTRDRYGYWVNVPHFAEGRGDIRRKASEWAIAQLLPVFEAVAEIDVAFAESRRQQIDRDIKQASDRIERDTEWVAKLRAELATLDPTHPTAAADRTEG